MQHFSYVLLVLLYFSDTSEISCVIVELNRTYLLQYYSSIQTHLKIVIKLTIHELAKAEMYLKYVQLRYT